MWKIMFTYSGMICNVVGTEFGENIIWHLGAGTCSDVMLSIKILSLSAMHCLFFAGVGWTDLSGDVDRLRKDFKSVDTAYSLVFAHALIHSKNLAAHHGFDFKDSFMSNTFPNVSDLLRLHVPNFNKTNLQLQNKKLFGELYCMHAGKVKKYTPTLFLPFRLN